MQIDRLSLRGFRNYEDAQAQFVPGVNLLVGGNASIRAIRCTLR